MLEEGLDIQKKGYLNEDFLFFHLSDTLYTDFELHYHDFHKLIIFISGDATYLIEGKFYKLKPWDVVFVPNHELHKPIISPACVYERMVLWIKPSVLQSYHCESCNLLTCFEQVSKEHRHLLRMNENVQKQIKHFLNVLEKATKDTGFGHHLLQMSSFLQLLVWLNRHFLSLSTSEPVEDVIYDSRIQAILNYINIDLTQDFSTDTLSQKFYLNKYYLMHLFKEQTGYSIHQYVLKKRLIKATHLIKQGMLATEVCSLCGFGDYSSFVRAFKKEFDLCPRDYYKSL